MSINSTDNLATVIGNPFQPFNWSISNKPLISLPHKDEVDTGLYLQLDHYSRCVVCEYSTSVLHVSYGQEVRESQGKIRISQGIPHSKVREKCEG